MYMYISVSLPLFEPAGFRNLRLQGAAKDHGYSHATGRAKSSSMGCVTRMSASSARGRGPSHSGLQAEIEIAIDIDIGIDMGITNLDLRYLRI